MRIPEAPPAGEAPRNIQTQPSRKRIVTLFVTFVLTTVGMLAGAPAATASTAPTVNPPSCAGDTSGPGDRGMYISSASDSSALACGGECPGFCPCPPESKDDSTPISQA